jgi:hypothetical protein
MVRYAGRAEAATRGRGVGARLGGSVGKTGPWVGGPPLAGEIEGGDGEVAAGWALMGRIRLGFGCFVLSFFSFSFFTRNINKYILNISKNHNNYPKLFMTKIFMDFQYKINSTKQP